MGVRVAFDVGSVRIGVAVSDPSGILASPQPAIAAGENSVQQATDLIAELNASEVVIGLPRTLRGGESSSTELARTWACHVEAAIDIPVILVDERLTTVQALSAFIQTGQKTKKTKGKIDSAAAAVILQSYLDGLGR